MIKINIICDKCKMSYYNNVSRHNTVNKTIIEYLRECSFDIKKIVDEGIIEKDPKYKIFCNECSKINKE